MKEEWQAIRKPIYDRSVIAKPADRVWYVVILYLEDYLAEGYKQLNGRLTYFDVK